MIDPKNLPKLAKQAEASSKDFFKKNRKKLMVSDELVLQLHEKIVEKTDCLTCANCCRILGPRVVDKDVERMAKALRMKSSSVFENYLRIDEDGDMVFRSMPCPFLMDDNYCMIYENRPKACREYPHTDRKKFYQIINLSIQNAATCPVVYQVIEELKSSLD